MAELKTYAGSCHCGQVRYEVSLDLARVADCNCSFCQKRGALWAYAEREQFRLLAGESALADYQFGRKIIHHLFCRTCGVGSFSHGPTPGGSDVVGVNVRCLDDVDLTTLTIMPFDGRSL
jgi:hypothetical protein